MKKDAKTLQEIQTKLVTFGYQPSHSEMDLIRNLLWELEKYREGGVTEEILRKNDGYLKVGKGCIIAKAP